MQGPTLIHFTDDTDAYGALYIGRTFEAVIAITGADGQPANLSDYDVACDARLDADDVDPAFSFEASIVDVDIDGQTFASAGIKLFLGATDAADLVRNMYWYDVKLTSKSNTEIVINPVAGNAQVEGTSTH
ncbi:hypothetical protein FY034_07240 [Trichlorobacter lovleyi]|uniref:hypothetical protein n=1 Tax=Trichlorobacter lovleyi TaxID=313985 RepID=UPI0022409B23|nr:hypothetical protein [Trichlorobacter lovleyi]QOX78730.1 hypothetical protein FY034_07240 [Trichlorobacter lovleyi]